MSLFSELKRRNVFRVGIAYAVAAWLLVEGATVLLDGFGAPDWVPKAVAVMLALGFPLALFFAWAFELTPEGLKRDAEVDHTQPAGHYTAKRLDVVTIVLVVLALGVFLTESWWRGGGDAGQRTAVQAQSGDASVAVLPFANMSTDAENEYFADGISEEILNLLADVRNLEVASRTSAFAFKGKDTPIPQIAAALGVRYVLEGSVRKSGDRLRVTAQLIDASTDRHLWSETFDRTLNDIFAVQDEIAGAIGDALQIELLGESGETVTAETLDPELYAEFLEARYLMRRRSDEALQQATVMLEEVVAAEPDFAKGLTILAEVLLLSRNYQSEEEWLRSAERPWELSERALELDPGMAMAWTIQGSILGYEQSNPVEGRRAYLRAIELDPTEPRTHHWLAILYSNAGYLDWGLASIDEALRLEPDNANANGWRATLLMALGRYDEAVQAAQRQSEFGNPATGYTQAAYAYVLAGDLDAAREYLEQNDRIGGNNRVPADVFMSVARDPSDEAAVRALLDSYLHSGDERLYMPVFAMAVLGLHEAFYEILGPGDDLGATSSGMPTVIWAEHNAPLRADPRFITLMELEGVLDLWRELGPPPDCRAEGDSFSCGHGYH